MNANTYGTIFRVTTFGESHGKHIGGIIDGCPAGLRFDLCDIQKIVDSRKPSRALHGAVSTARDEQDIVHIVSGVLEESPAIFVTLGTPISFFVQNNDAQSKEYREDVYRPGHGDYTYHNKFGIWDYRGGGRASARETVARVVAGALADQILRKYGIFVYAGTQELAGIVAQSYCIEEAMRTPLYAVDSECVPLWQHAIQEAREKGDSIGGVVAIEAHGVPVGLGEPVFDKLDARLAYAIMSVGAVKGVEIGKGFASARMKGSENNDPISKQPTTNNAGGILAGISTGGALTMRVAIKPIASIAKPQQTMTVAGKETCIAISGRHDCSAIPRIVPVLSAMVSLTLVDFLLLQESRKMPTFDK